MTIAVEDGGWRRKRGWRFWWYRDVGEERYSVMKETANAGGRWITVEMGRQSGAETYPTAGEAMRAVDDKLREMGVIGR